MNYQLLLLFIGLSFFNVILQTIKSLLTINGTKLVSATANAVAYALYTVVVIYTASDGIDLWLKVIITAVTNFVGVYISKWLVDKFSRDKLWKVELTVKADDAEFVDEFLRRQKIKFSPMQLNNGWYAFSCYCETQNETACCVETAKAYDGKISAYENKL